ncbi:MAG: hypothetical protein J6A54_02215 [Clostridia bacterium]|nr:hypothetical protein [Clostridia bacterium]
MKRLKILNIALIAIAIVLEALPFGIELNWELGTGLSTTMYYSYFNTIVWSENGDLGPFLCSILSIIILVLIIVSFFLKTQGRAFFMTLSALSWAGLFFSIMPLMYDSFTLIGGFISAIMILSAEINLVIRSKIK